MSNGKGNKEGDGDGNKGGRRATVMVMKNKDDGGGRKGNEEYGGNSDGGGTYNNQLKVSVEEIATATTTLTAMERGMVTAAR